MTSALAGRLPSSTRLSMLSIFQLNSPSARAPTRRPLPLRVWNTRRIGRSSSALPGSSRHGGNNCWRFSISSSNSSRKTSRISSSISSLLVASKPDTGSPTSPADDSKATSDGTGWAGAALGASACEAVAMASAGAPA